MALKSIARISKFVKKVNRILKNIKSGLTVLFNWADEVQRVLEANNIQVPKIRSNKEYLKDEDLVLQNKEEQNAVKLKDNQKRIEQENLERKRLNEENEAKLKAEAEAKEKAEKEAAQNAKDKAEVLKQDEEKAKVGFSEELQKEE